MRRRPSGRRAEAGAGSTLDRRLWRAVLLTVAVFATSMVVRPVGAGWDAFYDLGLYNTVYLAGAVLCWRARRSRAGLTTLAAALGVNVCGNVVYTCVVARLEPVPYPSVADAFYLGFYVLLYVAVVAAVRSRVGRLHAVMWLNGLVAGLGSAAVVTACLLAPAQAAADEHVLAVAVGLAYPAADVLLLVLLAASAAVLGLRADRSLVALCAGLMVYLAADLGYLSSVSAGTYVEGGPLDLMWLTGTSLVVLSVRLPPPASDQQRRADVLGWRVLALPLVCSAGSVSVLLLGFGGGLPRVLAWCAVACWLAGLLRTGTALREVRDLRAVRVQARTDELTGLPNRRALYELWPSRAGGPWTALVLFDLDGFKEINDSLGHPAGDELLRQVAGRVRDGVGPDVEPVRLGGDEFAVLVGGSEDAQALAERLQGALRPPFAVEEVRLHIGASFGVAHTASEADSLSEVLRRADVAMYEAKRTRGGISSWSDALELGMADRLRTIAELREGLTRGELVIHLQRQVQPTTGAVVGLEALVRWQHPTRGLLSPAELLPAAEQAGLLGPLTEAVLELALAAAARWWPTCAVPVAVNLSPANLTDPSLSDKVARALERHAVPPQALVLEVVEDTLMVDPVGASSLLRRLRESGVGISLDDYGTGCSSLAYLKDLPADELKIDRAFTADLTVDARSRAIVEHTVSLAHVLGLRVVAEGVEDADTLALLAALGCDAAQGYHVGWPAPVEQVLEQLLPVAAPVLLPEQVRRTVGGGPDGAVSVGCWTAEPARRGSPVSARV